MAADFPVDPPDPGRVRHVHLIGICGAGMASLAGMLKSRGYRVTGSDENIYPPMSLLLDKLGFPVRMGYRAENLAENPDLVVVGNAVSRGNPEVQALLARHIPHMSFPQALWHFFLANARPVVIAGTHGKTTSCAMLVWVLERAGHSPSFMAGGVCKNFGSNFQLGGGEIFVVEGDEYDSAFFDKEAKFFHYRPQALLLTAVEFDHADIYRDLRHVQSVFSRLVHMVPGDGPAVVCGDFPAVRELIAAAARPVETFGLESHNDWRAQDLADDGVRTTFGVSRRGERIGAFAISQPGAMNVRNALGVLVLAQRLGLSQMAIAQGLESFAGVERRQEVMGAGQGVTVIDDFAHHPTAVAGTIEALRARYPQRRLWAVFEPRSNTCRRRVFQQDFVTAFAGAHKVIIARVFRKPQDPLPEEEQLCPEELASDLRTRGIDARTMADAEEIRQHLVENISSGDVIVIMSNGPFGGLVQKLVSHSGRR